MRRVAASRVSIVATFAALATACRGSATSHPRAPAPPTFASAPPPRPPAPVAPVEVASSDPHEGGGHAEVARFYLREGTFATREETFRPGLVVENAFEGDVERDGSHVELVALELPDPHPPDTEALVGRVLVYLRHTAAGWRSDLFPVFGSYETYWRRPFVLGGHSVFVAAVGNLTHSDHLDADGDGVEEFFPGGVTYFYSLASRAPDGQWFVFEPEPNTREYEERYEFAGLPDDSLLITSIDGRGRRRWRVLQVDWTARRILTPDDNEWDAAGAWSRGAPPASRPRLPVTPMEGVTCRVGIDAPFRLRRTETSAPTGARYPAHTNVMIVGDTQVVRGDARLYRVRIVAADETPGPEGYAYVRGGAFWIPCPFL